MSDRQRALTLHLGGIGGGTVIREIPQEDLVAPNAGRRIAPTPSPQADNLVLYDGLARRRPGLTDFSATADPSANTVTGMYNAIFSTPEQALIVGTNDELWRYNEASDTWTDVASAATVEGTVDYPWSFAMVPREGQDGGPTTWMMASNGRSTPLLWQGGANPVEQLDSFDGAPTRARIVRNFLSRAFAINVETDGESQDRRIQWSVVGDATDWLGLGSGFNDLDRDPYPLVNAYESNGRLALFKGNPEGGAIYVGSPTGSSSAPLSFDAINPNSGVGILFPRSLVPLGAGTFFFIGHDAAYLYDGVRALQPFAVQQVREIRRLMDHDKIWTAWAVYHKCRREVWFFYEGASDVGPATGWVFDLDGRRSYGPMAFSEAVTAGTPFRKEGTITYDGAPGTMDTPTSPLSTSTKFFEISNPAQDGDQCIVGLQGGGVKELTGTSDDGTAISCTWYSPGLEPNQWGIGPDGGLVRELRARDYLTLRSVTLRHKSEASWTPVVQVSVDGGLDNGSATWTTISSGSAVTTTTGQLADEVYHAESFGQGFQIRVSNTTGDQFNLHSLVLEFTYSGR